MAYSQKVLNHYENPKNVGSFAKEEKNVGTGLVGAPACGDVMKLQIKVSDDGIIEDACFKTFGCLPSNNLIATPKGYVAISKLCAGDEVWAWNGVAIVKNLVKSNIKSATHYSRLLKLYFGLRKTITCTDDHVWWLADNRPIEAKDLTANMELLCATKNEFKSLNNVGKQEWMRQIAAATVRNTNTTQNIHARACFQTQRVSILPKFCATFWQNFAAVSGIMQKILPKNEPKFGQKRNVMGLKTGSNEAKMRLLGKKKEINSCNITSNLSFGFWINLFSSDYDKILWRSSLYKIFYTTKAKPGRGKLRERLEKFLILRNRISHCECIVHFPLQKYHLQLIEVIGWINSDIAKWLELETNLQNL